MKKRRSNGEGGLSWDKERQKWCGTLRDTNGKPHKFRHVDKVEVINWLNKMRLVYSSLNPLYSYDTTLQDFAFAFIKNKAVNPKIAESTVNYYTYLASKLYPLANEVMNKIKRSQVRILPGPPSKCRHRKELRCFFIFRGTNVNLVWGIFGEDFKALPS